MTERPGIVMVLDDTLRDDPALRGVQFFKFQHSPAYQNVQLSFLRAVNSYDDNNIAAILHAHPYHIDSFVYFDDRSFCENNICP